MAPVVHAIIRVTLHPIVDDEIIFLQATANDGPVLDLVDFIVQIFVLSLLESVVSDKHSTRSKTAYLPVPSTSFSCTLISSKLVQLGACLTSSRHGLGEVRDGRVEGKQDAFDALIT